MKLYNYKDPVGNFGDDLNEWLWPQVAPGLLDDAEDEIFLGIGTLIGPAVPSKPRKIVFGAGAGYGHNWSRIDQNWSIYCVRGPLTARMLGIDSGLAITDPAVLVQVVWDSAARGEKEYRVSLMPHHMSARSGEWAYVAEMLGYHYIDPACGVERVIDSISRSELLLTEAMHGAIVADALRVNWIPYVSNRHILDFKWRDWTSTLGLPYKPWRVPMPWKRPDEERSFCAETRRRIKLRWVMHELSAVARRARPLLSSHVLMTSLTDQILDKLGVLLKARRNVC